MQLEKLTYSLKEAQVVCGVSRTLLWRQIKAGNIQTVKFGHKKLIPADDLKKFLFGGAA